MFESNPRVSIGLPVYNGENYVTEAIGSLLAQTFTDFELIISDNGSTDSTPEICRNFAKRDSRVRYFRHEVNQGAAWNFNRTLELARGEYFQWHAHDDSCAPTLLERAVEMLDRDPAIVLSFARRTIIDHTGEFLPDDPASWRAMPLPKRTRTMDRIAALGSDIPCRRVAAVLLQSVWMYEQFGMMRRSALDKTGGMRSYYMSDWVLQVEMALRGRFGEIPETLFYPRKHAAQASTLSTDAARRNAVNPRRLKVPLPLPHQLRPTIDHFRACLAAPIGWEQRFRCAGVVVRYVFQVRKWRGIAVNTVREFCAAIGWGTLSKPNLVPTEATSTASVKSV